MCGRELDGAGVPDPAPDATDLVLGVVGDVARRSFGPWAGEPFDRERRRRRVVYREAEDVPPPEWRDPEPFRDGEPWP